MDTVDYINKNSNTFILSNFCGAPRIGKTTCMSGVANILADSMYDKIMNAIEDVPIIFNDIDFNKLDPIIKEDYEARVPPSITTKRLCKEIPEFQKGYNDGFSIVPGSSLVRQYVDAIEAKIRNNYVYALRSDFVRESDGVRAMPFERKMLAIRERHKHKDYNIKRYSVIVLDEKNNYGGERSTDSKKVANKNDGTTLFMATIGHNGHETIFMLSASQEFTREVKEHRALATAICYIRKAQEFDAHKIKKRWLFFKRDKLVRKRDKHSKNFEFDLKKIDPIKKKIFKVKQKIKYLRAQNYIRYTIDLYHFEKDLGKDVNQCQNAQRLNLTFKIRQCYGCISRYSFDFLQDKLEEESTPPELNEKFKDMFSDDAIIKQFLEDHEDEDEEEEKAEEKKSPAKNKKKGGKKDGKTDNG